jgi:hypothetical protein
MGRMMLGVSSRIKENADFRFIKIVPDSTIHTYGVGISLLEMRRHIGTAQAKVTIPQGV